MKSASSIELSSATPVGSVQDDSVRLRDRLFPIGSLRRKLLASLKQRLIQLQLVIAEALLPRLYYAQMRPVYVDADWDRDRKIYDRLHDWHHLRDGNRVVQAHLLLDQVKALPEGDYAELGTYRGNYARLIHARMAPDAKFYCFDTFEGFDDRDIRTEAAASGVEAHEGLFSNTSMNLVANNITDGAPSDRLIFRKGFFPETFAGLDDLKWRFVLLDADLYDPIRAGLNVFWPGLVEGGIILVHDYLSDYYKGAQQAVDEFCDPLGIVPIPWPDRVGSAIIVKPRSPANHTRGH